MKTSRARRGGYVRPWVWPYGLSVVALAVLVVLFIELGREARVDEPTDLDIAVHAWVVEHRPGLPWVTVLARTATRFGDPALATTATVAVAVGLLALHLRDVAGIRRSEPFVWVGVIVGGRTLSIWLKRVFMRDRPALVHRLVFEDTFSFPSGHSVFAADFFGMLAVLSARLIPAARPWLRAGAVAACVTMAVVVAASRVWLGVHYLTDVAGGLLLGTTWVVAVWVVRVGWSHRGEPVTQAEPPESPAS